MYGYIWNYIPPLIPLVETPQLENAVRKSVYSRGCMYRTGTGAKFWKENVWPSQFFDWSWSIGLKAQQHKAQGLEPWEGQKVDKAGCRSARNVRLECCLADLQPANFIYHLYLGLEAPGFVLSGLQSDSEIAWSAKRMLKLQTEWKQKRLGDRSNFLAWNLPHSLRVSPV